MPSNLSNGHTTPVEQDNNVMELNTYEAQQDSANIGAPNRAGLRGFIQAIRHAALGSFEVDNSPTARPRLPLHRDLKAYHSQLIALGSAIGTGLFIGAGQGLRVAGPIPLLLAFMFVGFTLCPTVFALGEMATYMPFAGGFVEHARRFVDDAWGAAVGWNYAFQWLITLPLELVAASITLQYWGQPLGHRAIWITIFLAGLAIINIFGVKGWANVEATLSLIKVVAIIGFLILGIFIDVGLGFGGHPIGVSNWYLTGAANHGWWGFCSVMVTAAFAFSGSEMVGLTAAEQENPERDMPRAIKKVFWRIGIFYIASIFVIGLLVPYTDEYLLNAETTTGKSASPFVIVVKRAGISALPSIFNAIILITVLSVANSSVYGSSRVLSAMAGANVGLAPKAFAYVDKVGRPLRCFYLASTFGFLAYLVELDRQVTVFTWLLALCGLASIISWTSICVTHIRFRKALKAQGIPIGDLPFRSPLGMIGTWIGLICNLFIIIIQFITAIFPVGWQEKAPHQRAQSFFSSFMAFPLLGILYLIFKYFKGTHVTGISFTRKHWLRIHEPKIVWGEGSQLVDLNTVEFTEENAWVLEDYLAAAEDIEYVELWWLPAPLRQPLKKMYFPW